MTSASSRPAKQITGLLLKEHSQPSDALNRRIEEQKFLALTQAPGIFALEQAELVGRRGDRIPGQRRHLFPLLLQKPLKIPGIRR
jgi:hypothetical protein